MKMLHLKAGGHLPIEGMEPRIIQGIKIWVKPVPLIAIFQKHAGYGKKSSKHRVMAECPQCKREMSAGRLHQHVCKED
jgi:hypothetical protein